MEPDDDKTRTHIVLTKGTMVSHYRIVEKIGAGGMGEVFLAEDTKLDRQVALKFLPPHLCLDEECRKRFKREAQATAKLNHPSIVTIHEVSDFQSRPFIAMEHVGGSSLKEIIAKGVISLSAIIEMARSIVEGLSEAHKAGITHRDIKPDNILVDSADRPKILDFGLAVIEGTEHLTQTGSTLGTIGYMSPEQIDGKVVDERSDLFSFGVVFYQLIAGRAPFKRETATAVLKAILTEAPEPLARYKSDVTEEMQKVITKLLEKDPSARYQCATDLLVALESLDVHPTGSLSTKVEEDSKRKMIVVLPFENLGPADEEYFADGMTEEIISRLSAIRDLGVISRTSAMKYKNSSQSIKEIGADLGVDYVMEGSVRWNRRGKNSDRVRITPQLIRTSDDTHIWSDRYDRTLDDIFEVQSQIAEQVVSQLDIQLRNPERQILNAKPTENIDAYQVYLQGLDFVGRPDYAESDFQSAIKMFEKATELDPFFALAYANLSRAHSMMFFHGYDRSAERASQAKAAVDKAYQLQPELAEVHLVYGYYYYYCLEDFEQALAQLDKTQRELPHDSRVLALIAAIVKRRGRIAEAVQYYERAFELSPRDASLPHEIGCAYMTNRKYTDAQHFYDLSIALAPDQTLAYVCKSWNYWLSQADVNRGCETIGRMQEDTQRHAFYMYQARLFARDYEQALMVLAEAPVVFDEGQWMLSPKSMYEAYAYQRLGDSLKSEEKYNEAKEILEKEIRKRPDDNRPHASMGIVLAALGNAQDAVNEAELSVRLMPVEKNAVVGPFRIEDLAVVHTLLGNSEAAVEHLEYLLSIPCWLSVPILRIDPRWDPLRDDTRFQSLLAKYGGK
ncbi:MAG: protein kinase [candidate division Zixibacteria bacterium]|nr:protein kinase [candidate division Zixibacteria bacterium]